jgi:hypothetical protein
MFPLGPKEDVEGIMRSLGGLFDTTDTSSQFARKCRLILEKLFSPGNWNVLAFRVTITPFYLSQNIGSTWYRNFIIKRSIARPCPYIVVPFQDATTTNLSNIFRTEKQKKNSDGLINIGALQLRSDEMK